MVKILANDGIDEGGIKLLEDAGFQVDTTNIPQDELPARINEYEVLLVRSATKVRKDLIDVATNLKMIGRGGVGMDNIDVEYAREKGITVFNTPAASTTSVAELVFSHLFSIVRFVQMTNRIMPTEGDSRFKELKKTASKGSELKGKTLGLIGFGRIGQDTARIAAGVGMNVVAHDPFISSADITVNVLGQDVTATINTVSKDEVLKQADFVSLHVPFSAGQTPIIGQPEIDIMKDGAGIVNCARGGAVDEKALLAALNSGKIAYAGLDVFEQEPPVYLDILKPDNVSLTPHIGAQTAEAQLRVGAELAENIISFYNK